MRQIKICTKNPSEVFDHSFAEGPDRSLIQFNPTLNSIPHSTRFYIQRHQDVRAQDRARQKIQW